MQQQFQQLQQQAVPRRTVTRREIPIVVVVVPTHVALPMRNIRSHSCYMISTLQLLFHLPSFVSFLQRHIDNHHAPDCQCIACAVQLTFNETRRRQSTIASRAYEPTVIYSKLPILTNDFNNTRQQDVQEFLHFLIRGIQVGYQNNNDGVALESLESMFCLRQTEWRMCVACENEREANQNDTELAVDGTLSVDIQHVQTPDAAIREYFEPAIPAQRYNCHNCNRKETPMRTRKRIAQAPNILCIRLKRFVRNPTATTAVNSIQK